jgi:TM2 domain-containing membrane protein YozV
MIPDTFKMDKSFLSPIILVFCILVMNSFNVHKLYGGRIGWDWRKLCLVWVEIMGEMVLNKAESSWQ